MFSFLVSQEKEQWKLNLGVFVDSTSDGLTSSLSVLIKQLGMLKQYHISLSKGYQKVLLPPITIDTDQIKLWWPRGYGNQQLYQIQVRKLKKSFKIEKECFPAAIYKQNMG